MLGVVAALAVHMFRVAVDGVTALDLRDGGGCVGGGAEGVRVVPYAAAKLDIVLVPVPPQNSLDLSRGETPCFNYFIYSALIYSKFTALHIDIKIVGRG